MLCSPSETSAVLNDPAPVKPYLDVVFGKSPRKYAGFVADAVEAKVLVSQTARVLIAFLSSWSRRMGV